MHSFKPITVAFFCLFFCILFYSSSFAACSTTHCVGKIERLYMKNDGGLYIGTDGNESNLICTSPAGVYVTMKNVDSDIFNRQYALLLTALTLGNNVTLRIIKNSDDCRVDYIVVDAPK